MLPQMLGDTSDTTPTIPKPPTPSNSDGSQAPTSTTPGMPVGAPVGDSQNVGNQTVMRTATAGQMGAPLGTQSTQTKIVDNTTDWTREHSQAMAQQYNARQNEFEQSVDWDYLRKQLQAEAAARGVTYDESDLMDIQRHAGYDASHFGDAGLYNNALQQGFQNALTKYNERADPRDGGTDRNDSYYTGSKVDSMAPGTARYPNGTMPGGGGYTSGTNAYNSSSPLASGQAYPYPGGQFSDPWNSQMESLLTSQLNGLTNAPPGSPQAMLASYLTQQFQTLAGANGYTPQEQAMLNTQVGSPIEALRTAANQRVLERAGQRGILPSSGLVQNEYATNDRTYDQMRTAANRDLAVNQINRAQSQRQEALGNITGLNTQQQQVNAQALQLATLLRQLPIDAQNQAMQVINGAGSPSALLQQVTQLAQQSQGNTSAYWSALAQALLNNL